jgi:nucleoside-diphosphate-sugar epimerase
VIPQLRNAGHQVLGLVRSEAGANYLRSMGAQPHPGSLQDMDSIRAGVMAADAVIHCAFDHDFSRFRENAELDARVIAVFGELLAGTDRALIVSTGLPVDARTTPITEATLAPSIPSTPRVSEQTALSLREHGVHVNVIRLPQVHSTVRQGLVTFLIDIAKRLKVSAYVDEGQNRWSACHVDDVARVYVRALETHRDGAIYHAIGEQGIALRTIAQTIGQGLNVPVVSIPAAQADAHFGFLGKLVQRDLCATSVVTRQQLDWAPVGPGLIDDIESHLRGQTPPTRPTNAA